MTSPELYTHVRKVLENNSIENAQFEAMCIVENVLGKRLNRILLEKTYISEKQLKLAESIAYRRNTGEPLQYILGEWEFFGMNFCVGEGVLIPRQDTEVLVETVIESARRIESPKIIDLCSGSGCIACAVAENVKSARVYALEKSEKAIEYLSRNIELNKVDIEIISADVLSEGNAKRFNEFDIIVCNPPYLTAYDMKALQKEVAFEPETALFGGDDGLLFYREITRIWKNCLKTGGILAYEIGMGQEEDVKAIMAENNFLNIEFIKDIPGIIRVVRGEKAQ